ncbi:UNVERIFIED_CONTAM: hypothetical protein Slati_4480500 [Sesamum latifolium]|uniref:Uncharacterized protein n=1 Tax=Sesamum latifolium TaxID=2727402 RepID=A0AAW2SRU4_9LAMI
MVSPPAPEHIVKKLPNHIQRYLSSLTPDKALAFAKRDIEKASVASDADPELYAPLFRNISTFKRLVYGVKCNLPPRVNGKVQKKTL